MKIDKAPAIAKFLKNPDSPSSSEAVGQKMRVALFYGPDAGLARERATELAKSIVPDLNDPFNVADLSEPDAARLLDEMAAQSLMGGRRLVRVKDGADALTPALQNLFANLPPGDSFLIVEAGELRPTSPLRKICEASEVAAAIPCYVADERDLAKWCAEQLTAHKVTATPDALSLLASSLADDRGVARQEVEKLITYANGKKLEYEDILAVVADSGEAQFDEPAWAAAEGDLKALDRSLDRLFAEGTSPVPILRAANRHFLRLLEVTGSSAPIGVALEGLKPPIFWKDKDRFRRQAERWRAPQLQKALIRLHEAEANCKKTGLRDTTMAARALMSLCAQAAKR